MGQSLEVSFPDGVDVPTFPQVLFVGIVDVESIGDVMDRSDEVIKIGLLLELPNPCLMSGDVIGLQGEFDLKIRYVLARFFNIGYVQLQIIADHVPIIPVIPNHGVVLGKTNFGQAFLNGLSSQFPGLTFGVVAQWRVHVVISW